MLCEQRGIPLVFLVNISGFMVGTQAEKGVSHPGSDGTGANEGIDAFLVCTSRESPRMGPRWFVR